MYTSGELKLECKTAQDKVSVYMYIFIYVYVYLFIYVYVNN